MPICLDAMAVVGQRRGQPFLDFFGEVKNQSLNILFSYSIFYSYVLCLVYVRCEQVMTGVKPKSAFLQPGLLCEIAVELIKQVLLVYKIVIACIIFTPGFYF
jgi:hypothetical protein